MPTFAAFMVFPPEPPEPDPRLVESGIAGTWWSANPRGWLFRVARNRRSTSSAANGHCGRSCPC
ncbi:hypothetical protein [Amycolatopsis sp. NPDC003731]